MLYTLELMQHLAERIYYNVTCVSLYMNNPIKEENISAISTCIYHQNDLKKQNALRIFSKLILA